VGLPAQHSSGRTPWGKNEARWGGWVVALGAQRFYFPGDTSYVAQLFRDIRSRVGEIQLAALPIGAYSPREWMRFEHLDPEEAILAHLDLGATRSIGVHWATFQLGDEEPYQPALDLAQGVQARALHGFDVVPIGQVVDVPEPAPSAVPARLSDPVATTTPEERHVQAERRDEAN
jgi:N-acyl-phosphatidylethanolamine-hydrolysing phospholipase D